MNNPFKLSEHQLKIVTAICENPDFIMKEIATKLGISYRSVADAKKAVFKKMKVNNVDDMRKKFMKKVPVKKAPTADAKIADALQSAHDDLKVKTRLLKEEIVKTELLTKTVNLKNLEYAKLKDSFDALSKRSVEQFEKIESLTESNQKKHHYILKLETDLRSLRGREKQQDKIIAGHNRMICDLRKENENLEKLSNNLEKENDRHDHEIEHEILTRPTHCTLCSQALEQME